MRASKTVLLLALIMTGVTLAVSSATILILYETAMTQDRLRLAQEARTQAILVDAIVGHELALGEPLHVAQGNAIRQIAEAHAADAPSTTTADFNLARCEGDEIVFLIRAGQADGREPLRRRLDAADIEPMRRALAGEAGLLDGVEYLGQTVIAGYASVTGAGLGVVAKVGLSDVRTPFIRAGLAILALALVMIALGTTLFVQVSTPMIEHLHSTERRYRELFDSMSSGVAVLEAVGDAEDFVFTNFNVAGERIDKLERGNVVGRLIGDVFPGAEASGLLDVLRRVWRTGVAEQMPARLYEDERIRGWRESFIYKLPSGEVVDLFDDVTERKATEDQLRQAQKMEVVGQLTGGVAHDFNNLLAIILGNLQLLNERLGDDVVARELVVDALWSAERGAELTHRLLAFARRQPLNPVVTDVNALVADVVELMRRTFMASRRTAKGIGVEIRLQPDLWPATIDPGQLESALMNLMVNARDAMPDGGTLTLNTLNVVIEAREKEGIAAGEGAPPGAYIMVAVQDTGVGIADEIKDRIFEPFFTTKRPGEGSGLGLSMVYGFAKQSGGHVEVESVPGVGTSVRLFLPPAEAAVGSGTHAAGGPAPDAPGVEGHDQPAAPHLVATTPGGVGRFTTQASPVAPAPRDLGLVHAPEPARPSPRRKDHRDGSSDPASS